MSTVALSICYSIRPLVIDAVLGRYNSSIYTNDTKLERIRILQEIQHPQYNSRTWTFDMMLLQLEHAPKWKQNRQYIRLNDDPSFMTGNNITGRQEPESLRAIGWGDTQPRFGEPSEILQQAELNFVPNVQCSEAKDISLSYEGKITDDMLCTFSENVDSCYGK
jgi:hypothetical protein